jgi:microcystin-dependent protein
MSQPFLGELKMFGGDFAIKHWALCNGQVMSLSQNAALFSLLGTFYGGNGTSNFGLPNLMGAAPLGVGQGPGLTNYTTGEVGGATTVALTQSTMPNHTHALGGQSGHLGSVPANDGSDALARSAGGDAYTSPGSAVTLAPSISVTGSGAGHANVQPYLCLNFMIALQGIFPSRN